MINVSDLGAEVTAAGLLIGLLTPGQTDGTVELNTGWFSNPISALESIGTRLPDLVGLLDAVLGPPAANPPPVFADAQWYAIPDPRTGVSTPFQIVATAKADAEGQIGLGVLQSIDLGGITASGYAYLPLFGYSAAGAQLLVDNVQNPCQVGLYITSSTPFQVEQGGQTVASFTALDVTGSIYLNSQAYGNGSTPPFIQVVFEDLTDVPAGTPNTYTTLQSLLSTDVESWLLQVLIQSGAWLSTYVGSTWTVGDILEAAGFLSRDYTFQSGNFTALSTLVQKLTATTDQDAVSAFLWAGFSAESQATLQNQSSTPAQQTAVLITELDKVVQSGGSIYDAARFAGVALSPQVTTWITQSLQGAAVERLNRTLLQNAYPLEINANAYQLNLGNLQGSASEIALNFVFAVLNLLSTLDVALISLPGGGVYITAVTNEDGSEDFGLRLLMDLPLTGATSTDNGAQTSNPPPAVNLCLGPWLTGESDSDNWMTRAGGTAATPDPGVSVLMLHRGADGTLGFAPSFVLTSIGLDIKGGANSPLFAVEGYTLGGTDLRVYLNPGDPFLPASQWQYGFAIRVDDLGFPLTPGTATGASGNPVAQNFLSSGGSGDDQPVNPAFSVALAWRSDSTNSPKINARLFGADGSPTDTAWLPIQRAFGPLHCQRLGINWPQPNPNLTLAFLFDGYVALGPLEVDLVDLSVGIPLQSPTVIGDYSLDLQGLAVSYASGPVSVSGGLVKDTSVTPTEYDGEALIQAAQWSLSAQGSYASLDGHPSLFIFARLAATIGGPAFFFVTGLCAGFGYNRSLQIPTQDQVPDFPLLAGIDDPSKIGGDNATPAQALEKLTRWIAPAQGVNWFAAGVQFTSFELIQSNVVLAVIVTGDFEAAVLGLSRLKLPQAGDFQFAYVELGLEVVIHPSAGFFGASAVITSNSFVIDPACHLTGGFAFYLWFAPPQGGGVDHSGDFVVTLGGYHPSFNKPDWYPDESRLGFSWQVSDQITMQGGAYVALTPSCVMGGGSLDLEFHAGNLRAWFTAQANFLFRWKPYYFQGSVGVTLGASYKLDLAFCSLTVSVELGADLEITGPPVAGRVHIDWYVISFSIPFGLSSSSPAPFVQWQDFSQMLPQPTASTAGQAARALEAVRAGREPGAAAASTPSNVCKLIVNDGLISQQADAGSQGGQRWLVRAGSFAFSVQTAFPLRAAVDGSTSTPTTLYPLQGNPQPPVAVRPMGITGANTTSTLVITLTDTAKTTYPLTTWSRIANLGTVPAALWAEPELGQPGQPTADKVSGAFLGLDGLQPPPPSPVGPPAVPAANLDFDPLDEECSNFLPFPKNQPAVTPQLTVSPTSLDTIGETVADATVSALRNEVYAALAAFGYDAGSDGTTADLAASVNFNYPAAPLLGAPWRQN